jgi:acetyltransferase-like isoleucine patch superfamily enzyme
MPNTIQTNVKIGKFASIEESSRGSILSIGSFSEIDDFVKIKFTGGTGHIFIGERVYINSGTVLYSGNGIKIGDYVLIGPNCSIVPVNHAFEDRNVKIINQRFAESKGGIVIEDDVWIGANVTILDGAYIRNGAVIGANSLVSGEVEEFSINVGTPLKCIGYRK